MGFLGPVAELGEALVRPHDLALTADAAATARARRWSAASCTSASRCASSSMLADGSAVAAQLTRAEADALELRRGRHRVAADGGVGDAAGIRRG